MDNFFKKISQYKDEFYDVRVVLCVNPGIAADKNAFYNSLYEHWLGALVASGQEKYVITEERLQELCIKDGKKNLQFWLSTSLAHKVELLSSDISRDLTDHFFSLFNNPQVFTNHTPYKGADGTFSYGSSPVSGSTMDVMIGCIDNDIVGFIVIMDED